RTRPPACSARSPCGRGWTFRGRRCSWSSSTASPFPAPTTRCPRRASARSARTAATGSSRSRPPTPRCCWPRGPAGCCGRSTTGGWWRCSTRGWPPPATARSCAPRCRRTGGPPTPRWPARPCAGSTRRRRGRPEAAVPRSARRAEAEQAVRVARTVVGRLDVPAVAVLPGGQPGPHQVAELEPGHDRGVRGAPDGVRPVAQPLGDHADGLAVPDRGDRGVADLHPAQAQLLHLLLQRLGGERVVQPQRVLQLVAVVVVAHVGVVGPPPAGTAQPPHHAPGRAVGRLGLPDAPVRTDQADRPAVTAQGGQLLFHPHDPPPTSEYATGLPRGGTDSARRFLQTVPTAVQKFLLAPIAGL